MSDDTNRSQDLLRAPLKVVNIGLESFARDLELLIKLGV